MSKLCTFKPFTLLLKKKKEKKKVFYTKLAIKIICFPHFRLVRDTVSLSQNTENPFPIYYTTFCSKKKKNLLHRYTSFQIVLQPSLTSQIEL